MNPLLELVRFGQSYRLDGLSRPMIESGELQRRVTEEGLTGVTANPAIFRAALHAMRDLPRAGIDVPQVAPQLLEDGVARFIGSLNDILQTIGTKAITGPHGEVFSRAERSNPDARRHAV